jgi:hypothetical protein
MARDFRSYSHTYFSIYIKLANILQNIARERATYKNCYKNQSVLNFRDSRK